jgi:hypothetical protein
VRLGRSAVGLSLMLALAVGALVLTRSPPRVVGAAAEETEELGSTVTSATACEPSKVPAGISAVRLTLATLFGPGVDVKIYSGSRLVTEGKRAPGWAGGAVTIPVKPVDRAYTKARLCFAILRNSEPLALIGSSSTIQTAAVSPSGRLKGRFGIEYLALGHDWWSQIDSVVNHMGFGHFVGGIWVVILLACCMTAVVVLVVGAAMREIP